MNARLDVSVLSSVPMTADQLLSRVEAVMHRLVQTNSSNLLTNLNSPATKPSTAVTAAVYHLQSGGRRIRARLALHAGIALGLSANNSVALAAVAELLHNASLAHDDLQDRDQYRRGVKTVWYAFGDNIAICAGDLLLSAAYGALGDFIDVSEAQLLPSLLRLVQARTAVAIGGQCADLAFNTDQAAVSAHDIAAYKKIAIAKSGALLSLPLELALVGGGQPEFTELAKRACEGFAIAYQIADDLHDVAQDTHSSDDQHTSLNAILVLRGCGHGQDSYRLAHEIALQHLSQADMAAAQLPNGVGSLLQEFVHELSSELTHQSADK